MREGQENQWQFENPNKSAGLVKELRSGKRRYSDQVQLPQTAKRKEHTVI